MFEFAPIIILFMFVNILFVSPRYNNYNIIFSIYHSVLLISNIWSNLIRPRFEHRSLVLETGTLTTEPRRPKKVRYIVWIGDTRAPAPKYIETTSICYKQSCGVGLKKSDSSNFSEIRLRLPTLTPDSDYQKHSVINSKVCTHRFFIYLF